MNFTQIYVAQHRFYGRRNGNTCQAKFFQDAQNYYLTTYVVACFAFLFTYKYKEWFKVMHRRQAQCSEVEYVVVTVVWFNEFQTTKYYYQLD